MNGSSTYYLAFSIDIFKDTLKSHVHYCITFVSFSAKESMGPVVPWGIPRKAPTLPNLAVILSYRLRGPRCPSPSETHPLLRAAPNTRGRAGQTPFEVLSRGASSLADIQSQCRKPPGHGISSRPSVSRSSNDPYTRKPMTAPRGSQRATVASGQPPTSTSIKIM